MIGRLVALVLFALLPGLAQAQSLDQWRGALVAGDWRSASGRPIDAFDNAVRDLERGLTARGFRDDALTVLSLRQDVEAPLAVATAVETLLSALGGPDAPGGCFLYVTSHGSPEGVVFGANPQTPPEAFSALLREGCGARPTVVVISACYSGVFAPVLQAPNRMVVTAARADRNSFGCGEGVTYPYFDGCVIQALETASDFIALAQAARACVAEREAAEGLSPPSEPQVLIGARMQLLLPTLRFSPPGDRPGS